MITEINCPDDIILTAAPGANQMQVNWDIPQGNTNCEIADAEIFQSDGPQNGSLFPIGTTTIEYTFSSGCQTQVSCSFDVIVEFQEAVLNFSCPENMTVNALIGATSAQVNWDEPNVSTNCVLGDASFEQISDLQNGDNFPIGTTTVSYQAQDVCDNSENCSFTVTVEQEELNLNLTCPNNLTVNAPIGALGIIVTWPEPVGNTNCEVGQTLLEQSTGLANGSFFPLGMTTIEYTYNACNENTTCSFELIVTGQDAVLNFSCPDNISMTAPIGSNGTLVNWDEPILESDCSLGESSFTQIEGSENGTEFPIGTTTVTYQAMDACDNQTNCSFDIIVTQEELTAEFTCPEDLEFNIPVGVTGLVVNWLEPEGSTNCQVGAPVISQISGPENGSLFPIGLSTISYQYDTGCDTELLCSFSVSIAIDSTTATTDFKPYAHQIKLYPNPANQVLNIDLGEINNKVENILIFNALGQKMNYDIETAPLPELQTIHLHSLSSGVYIALFQMKNSKSITKQFVIQR